MKRKFEERARADWLHGKFAEIASVGEQDYFWGFCASDSIFKFRVLLQESRIECAVAKHFDRWSNSVDFVHHRLPANDRQWFKFRSRLLEAYDAGRYDAESSRAESI